MQLHEKPVVRAKLLNRTISRTLARAHLATLTKWRISMQCAGCMLLLVLGVNFAQFQILHSYTLLLKSPALMRSCSTMVKHAPQDHKLSCVDN